MAKKHGQLLLDDLYSYITKLLAIQFVKWLSQIIILFLESI